MPVRRSSIYSLEVLEVTHGVVALSLHVSSGTYVRAIADALGGHCRSLRRTAVGPFTIDEAAPVEDVEIGEVAAALERLPPDALARVGDDVRAGVLALAAETRGDAA